MRWKLDQRGISILKRERVEMFLSLEVREGAGRAAVTQTADQRRERVSRTRGGKILAQESANGER